MYSQYKALKQMISVDQCKEKIADLVVFFIENELYVQVVLDDQSLWVRLSYWKSKNALIDKINILLVWLELKIIVLKNYNVAVVIYQ